MKKLILITALLACSSSWGACISGNCINGIGTYTWADGAKYVGEYKDDKRQGQGTFTYPDGDKYVGEWKDNKRQGQGTFTYASGVKYVGEWKDDKKHGQGTYTFKNGTKQTGFFLNGEFVPYLCQERGLTQGTDAFGRCVIKLIDEVNK